MLILTQSNCDVILPVAPLHLLQLLKLRQRGHWHPLYIFQLTS